MQKARMLQMLYVAHAQGAHFLHPVGTEERVNEVRVKTFIELTRQALDEDRVGQADLSYRRITTPDDPRPDRKRESEGLRGKG